jgi:hypothetical protein
VKNTHDINAMRDVVHRYDVAQATKAELECEIASLETDLERYYTRSITSMEAAVDNNNGYPHRILGRRVLTVGEVAKALLPVLREKLAAVEKEIAEL